MMKQLIFLVLLTALVLIAGCIGTQGSLNPLEAQKNLDEYYQKQESMTFNAEINYFGPNAVLLNRYNLGEQGFSTTLAVTVTSDSNETASIGVVVKDLNTEWESSPGLGKRNFNKNDTFYVYSYPISELGYIPKLEICINHLAGPLSEYRHYCFNKTLPPADLDIQISPQPVVIETNFNAPQKVPITITNNGIFSADVKFEKFQDPQNKFSAFVSSGATTLYPGQSATAAININSLTKDAFEASDELFFVQFINNLGEYLYRKPFTITVKQK